MTISEDKTKIAQKLISSYSLIGGPSKYDLSIAVMEGKPLTFRFKGEERLGEATIKVVSLSPRLRGVDEIEGEDSEGNLWFIVGVSVSLEAGISVEPQQLHLYYDSHTRRGAGFVM